MQNNAAVQTVPLHLKYALTLREAAAIFRNRRAKAPDDRGREQRYWNCYLQRGQASVQARKI